MSGEIAVGAGIALVGVGFLNSALSVRSAVKKAETWPTTEARVVRSRLIRNETGTWGSDVEYTFLVNGVEYASQIVNPNGSVNVGFTDKFARRVVEAYPVGTSAIVHFDPDAPEHAFLETVSSSASKVRLLIGLSLLLFGVVIGAMEAL